MRPRIQIERQGIVLHRPVGRINRGTAGGSDFGNTPVQRETVNRIGQHQIGRQKLRLLFGELAGVIAKGRDVHDRGVLRQSRNVGQGASPDCRIATEHGTARGVDPNEHADLAA